MVEHLPRMSEALGIPSPVKQQQQFTKYLALAIFVINLLMLMTLGKLLICYGVSIELQPTLKIPESLLV